MNGYVLKIIVNNKVKNDLSRIINLLQKGIFNSTQKLINTPVYQCWKQNGEAKIVLVGTDLNITEAYKEAIKRNITIYKYEEESSILLLILGPDLKENINEFTRSFKLL